MRTQIRLFLPSLACTCACACACAFPWPQVCVLIDPNYTVAAAAAGDDPNELEGLLPEPDLRRLVQVGGGAWWSTCRCAACAACTLRGARGLRAG